MSDPEGPVEETAANAADVDAPEIASASESGFEGSAPESESAEASASATSESASAEASASESNSGAPAKRRSPFYLRGRRLRIRLPKSRGGLFALLLVLSAVGFVGIYAGVTVISWTESADFCGRCHTMAPELQAYSSGPHRNVTCGECHVEPGIAGWVKAKMNGTRQLIDTVLGTYPTPIHPPEHTALPTTEDTCRECHSLEQRSFASVRSKESFSEDSENSREFVGLMVRPTGGDPFDVDRSVHNHVALPMEYAGTGLNGASIDYVVATRADGSEVEYICAVPHRRR